MDTLAHMTTHDSHHAFSALLQRHAGIVFKIAHGYARQAEDRDDLAQEIAAQLWHAWPSYDPSRSFSTWMYRVALNVAISHLRERSLRDQRDALPLDDEMPELASSDGSEHERDQHIRQLHAFIQRQAPLDRALLMLYLDERPQREIADILGISESNVSTKIGRLKQRIHDEL